MGPATSRDEYLAVRLRQNAPNARYFHTAVWTGSEMIVWGGDNYPVYDSAVAATTPPPTPGHRPVW